MVKKKILCETRQLKRTAMSCFFYFCLLAQALMMIGAAHRVYAQDEFYCFSPSCEQAICNIPVFDPQSYLFPTVKLPYENMIPVQPQIRFFYQEQYRGGFQSFFNEYTAPLGRHNPLNILDKNRNPFSRYNPDNFFRKYALDKQWKDVQKEFDALRKSLLQLSHIPPIKTMSLLK